MRKLILILGLLTSFAYAQSKAGFYVVGGKVITVQDTSSRNYLKAIENAGVVPSVIQNFASNYLVTTEKAIGTWVLMKAQYPFIGGTAATHIFNFNKPTGLAADNNLSFIGSWTHNSLGAKPNNIAVNTGSVANTFLAPTGFESNLSIVYSTNENIISGWNVMVDINAQQNTPATVSIDVSAYRADFSSGLFVSGDYGLSSSVLLPVPASTSTGVYIVTRASLSSQKVFKNGALRNTNNTTISAFSITTPFYLSGGLDFGAFTSCSPRRHQLTIIANAFTDTQSIQQSRAATAFNGFLSRN